MDEKATLDLTGITAIKDVAWMDERPQCKHLIAAWNAGRRVESRCESYGKREPGFCPMNGGTCAFDDLYWVFKPGWDVYAEWMNQGHGYITSEVWPGFRPGMLAAYVVNGDCMAPTWKDADLVIARIGKADFQDGAACVMQRMVHGWGMPLEGKYLKRLTRIGGNYLITADNPSFEPELVPEDTINIVAVAMEPEGGRPPRDAEGVVGEDTLDQLAPCHVFSGDGRIVPNLRAVARLTLG